MVSWPISLNFPYRVSQFVLFVAKISVNSAFYTIVCTIRVVDFQILLNNPMFNLEFVKLGNFLHDL